MPPAYQWHWWAQTAPARPGRKTASAPPVRQKGPWRYRPVLSPAPPSRPCGWSRCSPCRFSGSPALLCWWRQSHRAVFADFPGLFCRHRSWPRPLTPWNSCGHSWPSRSHLSAFSPARFSAQSAPCWPFAMPRRPAEAPGSPCPGPWFYPWWRPAPGTSYPLRWDRHLNSLSAWFHLLTQVHFVVYWNKGGAARVGSCTKLCCWLRHRQSASAYWLGAFVFHTATESTECRNGMDPKTSAPGRNDLPGLQPCFCLVWQPLSTALTHLRRPLPGAALFFCPFPAFLAGEGPGQIPVPRAAQVLICRPGHHALVAEQPVQELQLRVAVLL